jgi:hypothetical protein
MRGKISIIFTALFCCLLIPYGTEGGTSIVGGLTHERVANADETYQGVILLRNSGDEPQEVKLYQTDYLFFFDGRNIYGQPGNAPRSNANWITFSPHRLVIPPQGTSEVHYTVGVPDEENSAGTYWSMIMVEEISKNSPEASKSEKGALMVGQVIRYGIQMVTHIGNSGTSKLNFLNTRLLKDGEKRILQVDVENIGERWLRSLLWVELFNEEGNFIGRFEGRKLRIYPGTSVRYRVNLSEVPRGEYKTLVVADCGGDNLFGATYTSKFEK